MLNKMRSFLVRQDMIQPGDRVICALSGGADSVAMTFAFYLLKEKLGITLEAAHFNHHLRGAESDRDEAFVRSFCDRYDIPLHVGSGEVSPGKKGLEAAAREARYAFLRSLPGKIATAHTADDNAETVLLHLIRGTGLKGLGGITPVHGKVIRPMLSVTRQEVEAFLEAWCLSHIEDSSNQTDAFLRNRIRHTVMPLLKEENPRIGENLSQMALRLREEEAYLSGQAEFAVLPGIESLKTMHPAIRTRVLAEFLVKSGVKEPEDVHISQAEALPCPGAVTVHNLRITSQPAAGIADGPEAFTVCPRGEIRIRSRQAGDAIRLAGGTKSLKKLFIDRKIPAAQRERIPVVSDDEGILGVYSIGKNLERTADTENAVTIRFEKIKDKGE